MIRPGDDILMSLLETGQLLAHFNPFIYMIDGFRYGFTDRSDADPFIGKAVLCGINLLLWLLCPRLIATGF